MTTLHVVPTNDVIEHGGQDCECGPTAQPVMNDDGSTDGWLYKHHSLDGRELRHAQA